MNAIGGYFELELGRGNHYHPNALRLNTAKNAFEYILRVRGYRKVYLPYYTCEVMLQPLRILHIDYEFYRINAQLEPAQDFCLLPNEAFLYTNYYGLKQQAVERLAKHYHTQLIVDNAQAFFAEPMRFTRYEEATEHIKEFHLPVMIKPVDSSGSKGINKLTDVEQLETFVEEALSYSRAKRFLIEEFLVKKGHQISGDAFSVDGKLVFHCLGNEFYNPNCDKDFAPLGECWPFQMDHRYIEDLETQLQRAITLLGMKSNAYNVEAIVGDDDKVYLLELVARSGGSLIPQVTEYATGINMVTWVIQAAAGDAIDLTSLQGKRELPIQGYWSNYMVHSNATGKFASIHFDEQFRQKHLVDWVTDLQVGDEVHRFRDAQDCIGEFILKYDSMEQMFEVIKSMDSFIHVEIEI